MLSYKTMMKKWVKREPALEADKKELGKYPEILKTLLLSRGVKTKEGAEIFLNPDYEAGLGDPFTILNMEKAVERILAAIKGNEKVVIYADYDADGVSSAVILCEFFKKVGFDNFHVHIPDRHLDGYGLNHKAVEEFSEQGTNLVITLDCGVTDFEEIDELNKRKIDVVIIDHHKMPEVPPKALVIVDVHQKEDNYPFKDFCGAGIAFKVVTALIERGGFSITTGWEKWLLDLVAVATIADMMPLTGENRTLVFYGLQVLKKTKRTGLLVLLKKLNIDVKNINEGDVGFMIAPRINITSRMGHASSSYSLLTTSSQDEAAELARHIDSLNSERRRAVDEIIGEVEKEIKNGGNSKEIIVFGNIAWKPGVLGLAAMRIMEKYRKPVFLWGKGDAPEVKGSARSGIGINLVELMRATAEGIFIHPGGHPFSAGFSINADRVVDLEKELFVALKKIPHSEMGEGEIKIDEEITIDQLDWNFYSMMEKFQPFGMANENFNFLFSDLKVEKVRQFGNGGIHLQLDFKKTNGKIISAIGFFASDSHLEISAGQEIDLVANLEKNTFRGANELRLRIVDLKVK